MKLKTVAMTGVLSLAGLGLIGAGAHAAFTTSPTASQTITASSISVVTWSANDINGCTTEAYAAANPAQCQSVTLPAETVGSVFDTTPQTVWVQNLSSEDVYETNFSMTLNYNNGTLANEVGLCSYSDGTTMYSGLIAGAQGPSLYNPTTTDLPAAPPGGADSYVMEYFAGENPVTCSAPATPVASLTNGAEGGSLTATFTLSISDVNGFTG